MSPKLISDTIQALNKGLNFSTHKNRVIASNIANIETPGYKAFKVVMDEKLKSTGSNTSSKLKTTHPNHLSGSQSKTNDGFRTIQSENTSMRQDGNNVDLERELAELNANAIYFTALSRFISKNFTGLRNIISEGKR
ncbi:flagellar basal body rod protein FlgB [bacterium]|nr:flagellar basal body rod protein FlgB [bacterium]MBU1024740.1 flagellar basal body rod protein FlgB [bacterium]